jgi:DNA modification methylase
MNFSNIGSLVIDPFSGTGTTLIACEKTNRKCYGMELDPHYCTVILQRWADFTGEDPVREDGVKFSEVKRDSQI